MSQMTPMERELLKSVERLSKQSEDSALRFAHSASSFATATRRDMEALMRCMTLLVECQTRLVNWCRASEIEAAVDGSATRALAEVQQQLLAELKALK